MASTGYYTSISINQSIYGMTFRAVATTGYYIQVYLGIWLVQATIYKCI